MEFTCENYLTLFGVLLGIAILFIFTSRLLVKNLRLIFAHRYKDKALKMHSFVDEISKIENEIISNPDLCINDLTINKYDAQINVLEYFIETLKKRGYDDMTCLLNINFLYSIFNTFEYGELDIIVFKKYCPFSMYKYCKLSLIDISMVDCAEVAANFRDNILEKLIYQCYEVPRLTVKSEFFAKYLKDYLNENIKDGWFVEFNGKYEDIDKKYAVNLSFSKNKDWKIVYWLRFEEDNMEKMYWAIAKIDKTIDLSEIHENVQLGKQTDTSIVWDYSEVDLDKHFAFLLDNKEELAEKILNEFYDNMNMLNQKGYSLEKINADLANIDK